MQLLNKVTKSDSNMAWTCPAFSITKKDEPIWIELGVLHVVGPRAVLKGDAETVPNFTKDAQGEYTVPAGNRLTSVNGQFAEQLVLIKAKQAAEKESILARKEIVE